MAVRGGLRPVVTELIPEPIRTHRHRAETRACSFRANTSTQRSGPATRFHPGHDLVEIFGEPVLNQPLHESLLHTLTLGHRSASFSNDPSAGGAAMKMHRVGLYVEAFHVDSIHDSVIHICGADRGLPVGTVPSVR